MTHLLERDGALQQLNEALSAAMNTRGRLLLVHGEAGIGKSSLVDRFLQHVGPGVRQAVGHCDELFAPTPLAPLYDIGPQLAESLDAYLDDATAAHELFTALLAMLQRPTVLVFEDVHWADKATLDLLKYLGRRVQNTRSIIIVTYRDDQLDARHPLRLLVGDLSSSVNTAHLTLGPLSLAAVTQLCQDKPVDSQALYEITGGNPFFVSAVLDSGAGRVPETVRDAILARLARLSLSGRAALDAAAVIGTRVEPWLLQDVTEAEAGHIDESMNVGFLVARGQELAFRHELVRQVVLAELAPHRALFLHRAVLEGLQRHGFAERYLARLVNHAIAAGAAEDVVTFGQQAAELARLSGMYRDAGKLYEAVLQHLAPADSEDRLELMVRWAVSLQTIGGTDRIMTILQDALAMAARLNLQDWQGFLKAQTAFFLAMSGAVDEAELSIEQARELLAESKDYRSLAELNQTLGTIYQLRGRSADAIEALKQALEYSYQLERPEWVLTAQQRLALVMLNVDQDAAIEMLQQVLADSISQKMHRNAAGTYTNLAMIHVDLLRLADAEQFIRSGLAYCQERDLDGVAQILAIWQAFVRVCQGEWETGRNELEQILVAPNLSHFQRNPATAALIRLYSRQGDFAQARELVARYKPAPGPLTRQAVMFCPVIEFAWLSGDRARFAAMIADYYPQLVAAQLTAYAGELAYWQWQAGEPVAQHEWVAEPYRLQIAGQWREAAACWLALGYPYEAARALSHGDQSAKLEALTKLEELGAQPLVDTLRAELRQAGLKQLPRGRRASTLENPFGLTNRQVQILALLTEALSNTEIAARLHLSPKTVGHHVSAILGTLQVSSREEAAELARQHPHFHIAAK